jgi:hypothetical protein
LPVVLLLLLSVASFLGNFSWHPLHLHTHQDTRPHHPHLHLQHPQLMLGLMLEVMAKLLVAGHQNLLASTLQDGFKI